MDWKPISEAKKDPYRDILLRFDNAPKGDPSIPLIINGWWFPGISVDAEGWETPFGFVGEPTHFAEFEAPKVEEPGVLAKEGDASPF